MGFVIDHLDHLVLTVANIDATTDFYTSALGMELVSFNSRRALRFGEQKINLHQTGNEFEPKAAHPTPGSGDLCFITKTSLEDVISHLTAKSFPIEVGPVERSGAVGKMRSVYLRDPDSNLIEIMTLLGFAFGGKTSSVTASATTIPRPTSKNRARAARPGVGSSLTSTIMVSATAARWPALWNCRALENKTPRATATP